MPRKFRNFGEDLNPAIEQGASLAYATTVGRFQQLPTYTDIWANEVTADMMVPLKAKSERKRAMHNAIQRIPKKDREALGRNPIVISTEQLVATTEANIRILATTDHEYSEDIPMVMADQIKTPYYGIPVVVSELLTSLYMFGSGQLVLNNLRKQAGFYSRSRPVIPQYNPYLNGK